MIGICTDSNAQLPPVLAERYGVEVVPLTVAIDDREYLEGVDLDVDEFYDLFRPGHVPTVRCNQPSPGQFASAYDDLVARGCTEILSIHTGGSCSSSLLAAKMGAHSVPVPVRLVDTGTARFPVSCCVWAAGAAIAGGASLDEAAAVAESLAPAVTTVFVAPGPTGAPGCSGSGHRVHALGEHSLHLVADVATVADAVNAMTTYALQCATDVAPLGCGHGLNVGVGWTHRDTRPIADAVAHALGESAAVAEVVSFRIGPSVGVDTGPDAFSCVVFPG